MGEIRTSGWMSGDGKRGEPARAPHLRASSTLPTPVSTEVDTARVGACATIYSTSLTMDHARIVLGFDRTKSLLLNIALRNHVRRPRMGRRHTWRAHLPLCGVFRKPWHTPQAFCMKSAR